MVKIYFIRHGVTGWNKEKLIQGRTDNPLSEEGIIETIKVAHKIKELNINFDLFISSPLIRAKETIDIIKHILSKDEVTTIIDPAFNERSFGELEGKPFKALTNALKENRVNNIKGYENDKTIQTRVYEGTLKLKEYEGKTILIASHSNTIKSLLIAIDKDKFNYDTMVPNLNLMYFSLENNKLSLIKEYVLKNELKDTTAF